MPLSSRLILAGWRSRLKRTSLEAGLVERLSGRDEALLNLAGTLLSGSEDGYPNGPLFWNEVASNFLGNLIARHTSQSKTRARGKLGKEVLKRLTDYIIAHLDEPIEIEVLASIAGRSPFHFTRVFARSVGLTPHRYIVHLRLQRASAAARFRGFLAVAPQNQAALGMVTLSCWSPVHGLATLIFDAKAETVPPLRSWTALSGSF